MVPVNRTHGGWRLWIAGHIVSVNSFREVIRSIAYYLDGGAGNWAILQQISCSGAGSVRITSSVQISSHCDVRITARSGADAAIGVPANVEPMKI
jgi:hypothetical protein